MDHAFPTQSCLLLYSFCACLLYSLIMWITVLSLNFCFYMISSFSIISCNYKMIRFPSSGFLLTAMSKSHTCIFLRLFLEAYIELFFFKILFLDVLIVIFLTALKFVPLILLLWIALIILSLLSFFLYC